MAIFDFFSRKKEKNALERALYEYRIFSGSVNNIADDPRQYIEQGYQSNTTVYAIINRINAMAMQARLRLVDKNGDEVLDHELSVFLKKLNKTTSVNDFINQILIYRLTIGEVFVYKPQISAGLNKGRVNELTVLPSADVEIIEGNLFEPVRGYKIEGNYNIELPESDVFHSKMFNPNFNDERSFHGMSPLRAASRTVSKLNQIEITETKQFENQGAPYILFKDASGNPAENRLSTEQISELERKVKSSTKAENKGLPLILKDKYGKIDLGSTVKDIGLIESSNSGIIALCALYGYPPELLGYGQKTYSNMATARKAAWTDCIMPNLIAVTDILNECLIYNVKEFEGLSFNFDYSEVEELQEGMELKVAWMNAAGWSGNEIRYATGQPTSDNPIMDEPRIPMGVTMLSDYAEPLDSGEKSYEDYKQ